MSGLYFRHHNLMIWLSLRNINTLMSLIIMFLPSSLGHCVDVCVLGQDTLPSHASLDSGVNDGTVYKRTRMNRSSDQGGKL